jgi:hypothetical protein
MKSSDIERRERRELIGSTGTETFQSYRDRAFADMALEAHGRHAAAAKAEVTGRTRIPQYPRMPEGSPWAGDLVPPEEALGWSVEAQEPTGNYHEIAESLREAASLAIPSGDAADEATEVDDHSASGAEAPPVVLSPAGGASLRRGRKL